MAIQTNNSDKNNVAPLVAGVAGMVIGAAAIALTDKQTRDKATKTAKQVGKDLHKWSTTQINTLHKNTEDSKSKIKNDMASTKQEALDKVDKELEEMKDK